MKADPKLISAIDKYLDLVKADYSNWNNAIVLPNDRDEIKQEMIARFNDSIYYDIGKKYVKIVIEGGVHSFIVKDESDAKFVFGDILKAASWKTPARNYKRGNVFELESSSVNWTGAQ